MAYLLCNSLMRTIMFRWPCEYCSITSRTSYGLRACWNFLLATKYLMRRMARMALRCCSVRLQRLNVEMSCQSYVATGESSASMSSYTLRRRI